MCVYVFSLQVEQRVVEYTEGRCKKLSKSVHLHLNNPQTNNKMFQWRVDQFDLLTTSYWQMHFLGSQMIHDSIEKEITLFWEKEDVGKLSSEFENFLLEQLLLFDEQSREVRKLILNHRVNTTDSNDQTGMSLLGIIAIGAVAVITAPLWIPFSIVAITYSLATADETESSVTADDIENMKEFKSKPLAFMVKWSDNILLHNYSEINIYRRLECEYIQSFRQKVRHVCGNIVPKQIKADTMFIKNVANDIRSYQEIRKVYLPFGEKAKVIMGKLLIIYLEYFSHYAVATENLRKCARNKKWEGRFAHVHEIEMLWGQKWVKAVAKTMKQPLNTDISFIQLTEVDLLR